MTESDDTLHSNLGSPIRSAITTPSACVASPDALGDRNAESVLVIDDITMIVDVVENGIIGCAFFSSHDNRLSIAQDVGFADEQTLAHFVTHIQPLSIIISARFPDKLRHILDEYCDKPYPGKLNTRNEYDWLLT